MTDTFTILIVDDTSSNLGVVVNLFEERGYRVSIAQDGEEGVRRAELLQPNLILLDVMMPGMDGFETCGQLKARESTRDIPVIFMTALASVEHKVNGFQAGAVDYVTKPLQIDEVLARVDTHLKLHAAQRKLAEQNEELERRVAERTAELTAREREFRTLVEHAPDDIARHDRQCRYFYINPQHEKTLGIPTGDVTGKAPVALFPGNPGVAAYQALMREVIETGRSADFEATLPDEGAGPRYHNILLVAERDAEGEVTGVLAIGRDVTERKRAERELQLLNRALDHAFDATYLVDTDMRFRYVNEAATRELGYSREELLSMDLLDIDPNITREMVQALMEQTAAAGRFHGTVESRHRRRDGTTFPVEIGATTFGYDGETLFLTVVRDITERKQAEQRLHEKAEAIRAVVENSPDAIARYDAELRRIYVNPTTQKLFGLPLEQILGKTPLEISPVSADFMQMLRGVFASGEEFHAELPFHKANGEAGWGDLRIVPEFGPDGGVITVLAIGRDITGRKQAEHELEESRVQLRGLTARREEVREEERRYIAREVHDELGQILTGLQLDVSMLIAKYGKDSPALHEHLQGTLELVNKSLATARNVASALRPASLDMGIVSAIEWLAGRFGKNTGIACEVHVREEDRDIDLGEGVSIALFRIAQESLTNAARHAQADRVDITFGRDDGDCFLEVRDNGRGFDTEAVQPGSFGLVGIRERVLLLGGEFAINSVRGRGTAVEVRIPARGD